MVIWAKLTVTHWVWKLATQLAKCCKFLTVAKGNEESIMLWASHVKGIAFDLEDIGGTMTNEDIIIILTTGLNNEYDHFVVSVNMMPMQMLIVDYVVTRMLNEEI
jgi:hypothetical protein